MKGQWIDWQPEELAWIEEHKELPRADLHAGFVARFNRPEITVVAIKSLCKRKRWLTGRNGFFMSGVSPTNRGGDGYQHPNSIATRFKKGHGRSGHAVTLYKPIGSERIVDGYLQRKVNDDLPLRQRWMSVHRINWEEVNGRLPEGHVLKCLDGNRLNTDPSNWRPIPIAMLPRLNGRFGRGYDDAPAELKPLILAVAELEHAARQRRAS